MCKSSSKKGPAKTCKTFTLRDINLSQVSTCNQLKQAIKTLLADDVISDFDVGYYQASTVVSIRSPQDIMEIWNDMRKGVNVILWFDGLEESNPTTTTMKRSKKKADSDSDYDEDVPIYRIRKLG